MKNRVERKGAYCCPGLWQGGLFERKGRGKKPSNSHTRFSRGKIWLIEKGAEKRLVYTIEEKETGTSSPANALFGWFRELFLQVSRREGKEAPKKKRGGERNSLGRNF